jgi:hypothetical protein
MLDALLPLPLLTPGYWMPKRWIKGQLNFNRRRAGCSVEFNLLHVSTPPRLHEFSGATPDLQSAESTQGWACPSTTLEGLTAYSVALVDCR